MNVEVSMLHRHVKELIQTWARKGDKPLLITGARQVGKTFIVRESLKELGKRVHTFNFEKIKSLSRVFEGDLNPSDLVKSLSLAMNESIDIQHDIIFFDEIQACERAVTSLKYFYEDLPEAKIIATGSYIGLMQGFPVGKVNTIEMFPLTFAEFLYAIIGEGPIMASFRAMDLSVALFDKIWPMLLEYFYVGGLPEAVNLWLDGRENNPVQAAARVREFHRQILQNYSLDFGKYSGRNAPQILGVFQNIAQQLSQHVDDSVGKYKFKDVLPNKKSYAQLQGPISWLEQMRMLHRAFIVEDPHVPLLAKESVFRLFTFDMGILSTQLELTLAQHLNANFDYKGYVAENFVALELMASGCQRLYGWESSGTAEIEFVLSKGGEVAVPIEVKSGKRTRSKSLETYRQKYKPEFSIKLIGSAGSRYETGISLPLYYAGFVRSYS